MYNVYIYIVFNILRWKKILLIIYITYVERTINWLRFYKNKQIINLKLFNK